MERRLRIENKYRETYMGYDIGGTSVKYALMNQSGDVLNTGFFPTPVDGLDHLLYEMKSVMDRIAGDENVEAVVVSSPGAVDSRTGIVHGMSALPYIHEISFSARVSAALGGRPVSIENDARCFALGEMWRGIARKKNILPLS